MKSAVLALCLLAPGVPAQPAPSASVQQFDDAIVFQGRIDSRSAAEFLRLLQDARITRLLIDSEGGLVTPALDMAEALHARGLDVEVTRICLSSCANYIVPAGRRKILAGPFVVGWHGNIAHVLYRSQTGQERWTEPQLAEARRLARREAAFFRRIGVDEFLNWFGKIPPYGVAEFYTLSLDDMARFGLRDVEIRDPGLPPPRDVRRIAVDWRNLEAIRPVIRLED